MRRLSSLCLLSLLSTAAVMGLPAHAEKDEEILSALSLQVGTCFALSEHERVLFASDQGRVEAWLAADRYWALVEQRWDLSAERVAAEKQDFIDTISGMEARSPGMGSLAAASMESVACCLPDTLAAAEPGECPIARGVSKSLGVKNG